MNSFSIVKNIEICNMNCVKTITKTENGKVFTEDGVLELKLTENKIGDTIESTTTVKNVSCETVDINQLSSAYVRIDNKGNLPWYDENKYRVYYCQNTWLGEGQWIKTDLDKMGLYGLHDNHKQANFAYLASRGSFATGKYYPMLMIEDLENNEMHYFEILTSGSWYMQICIEYDDNEKEAIHIFTSGQCEKNDAWHKLLKPQESLSSLMTVYGTVKGGFEEAVKELTIYKRKTTMANYPSNIPPVFFNDYMNCCWAMPTYAKSKALIDAAVEMGAEVFCFDSGWQASLLNDDERFIGDWAIAKKKFAPSSFEKLVEYGKSKGLKMGAWLEIEGVAEGSKAYDDLKDYMLKRRGHIVGGKRCFFDFRTEFIQNKIEKVFDMLYERGIRFIKNDYNQTLGIGADGADSLSEIVHENTKAFLGLIEKVKAKYPDLIIENCGSGSQRCGHDTLKHFNLQSTSDQEVYVFNPGIINGALAYLPPEKAGIWTYPYPVRFDDRMEGTIYPDDYSDAKQTIFNMVNSLSGVMYMSGRIDACDELNKKMIKEAVSLYKEIRSDIPKAFPIYPIGTFRMNEKGVKTFGLMVPEKNVAYLSIWRVRSNDNNTFVDLSKYGKIKKVEKLYPSLNDYDVVQERNGVRAMLPDGNSAVFIKITF